MTAVDLLTVEEVAEITGVTRRSVYSWIMHGRIPVVTLPSGRYRIRRDDLNRMIESETVR